MVSALSTDGTNVIAIDEGTGPVIVILHGGMSDESAYDKVAAELTGRFRVVRIRRRIYRLELPPDPATTFARQVEDVLAVAGAIGEPIVVMGHSSGAILALETLATNPDPNPFVGAVLYEAPIVIDGPLGGEGSVEQARAALAKGQPGRALTIFLRRMVGLGVPVAQLAGALTLVNKTMRDFVPRQIDDTEAIDRLGPRLPAYAEISTPILLVSGARSPATLKTRTEALAAVLPHATSAVMPRQAHGANNDSPAELAELIATFADDLFTRPAGGSAVV